MFGWTVATDPHIPMTASIAMQQIQRMDAPDDLTLVIEWRSSYPFAAELVESAAAPLPTHLLAASYGTDSKEQFIQLPTGRDPSWGSGHSGSPNGNPAATLS